MREIEADVYIRQGDTRPFFEHTLTDRDGNRLDLTAATGVKFSMAAALDGSVIIDQDNAVIVGVATQGDVRYPPTVTATETPGDYVGEFEVTWDDSKPEGVPARDGILIRVTPRLDTP